MRVDARPSRGTMYDRNPVNLALLHMLPRQLAARGMEDGQFLARAGLRAEDCRRPGRYAPRAQVCALLEDVARLSGEPAIGIELGHAADPARLGSAGLALMSGATLAECLARHARELPGLQAGVALQVERKGGAVQWRHRLENSDPERAGVLSEGVVSFILAAIRSIIDGAVVAEVTFPHRRRAPASDYEDGLQAAARFAPAGRECIVSFDADLLDAPNRSRPPGLPTDPPPEPRRTTCDDAGFPGAVDRLIAGLAPTGDLSLVRAAQRLGLSPRSLQRRLAGSGESFEARVDAWRRGEARRLLGESGLAVAAVASALGYADASHFVRAFRRWEGMPPHAWRTRGTPATWREMAMANPAGAPS